MAKGWHREPRRHSLASRGIKTACKDKGFTNLNDYMAYKRTLPKYNVPTGKVEELVDSLRSKGVQFTYERRGSFTDFTLEKGEDEKFKSSLKAVGLKTNKSNPQQVSKIPKTRPPTSPPIPDTPSRFENPPLGYDDWEQFNREYGHEVDEYGN